MKTSLTSSFFDDEVSTHTHMWQEEESEQLALGWKRKKGEENGTSKTQLSLSLCGGGLLSLSLSKHFGNKSSGRET